MAADRAADGPIRRSYGPGGGQRDVDAFETVARIRILGWSLVGAFLGGLLGVFLTVQGDGGVAIMLLTTFIGWVSAYVGPILIMRVSGRAGAIFYAPSGRSTPHKREYSQAEAYAARAQYPEAVAAFEEAIAADGSDPTPYLRVARLQRDKLGNADASATWFRRALAESEMNSGLRLLTCKELLELYEVRMGKPERATPFLARISEERPEMSDGKWAAGELGRIKEIMARESNGA